MQKGQIIKRGRWWYLRYWKEENVGNQVVRRRIAEKLAPFNDQYRNESKVRQLAKDKLEPVNTGKAVPGELTIQQFIDTKYLPYAKEQKRPSTYAGYSDIARLHIMPNIGGLKLRDFKSVDAQRLIDTLVKKDLTTRSLLHIKSFLSGVISYAIRSGEFEGPHPMLGRGLIVVEGGKESSDTYAYTLDELIKMIEVLEDDTSRVAVTVAGFTGLSLSEMRGLRWENVNGEVLNVERTFWERSEGTTKTKARKAPVPLLPEVMEALKEHRKRNPDTTFVFEGPYFKPLDLATLGSKRIKTALAEHGLTWHGWHAFRRGLGTNLNELGVPDKIIQVILRHSSVATTQGFYIKPRTEATQAAMKRLAQALKGKRTSGKRRRKSV
jgi:integrase